MSPQPYAHLLPAERVLWARYLRGHPLPAEQLDYDARLGQGRPSDPTLPQAIQDDWIRLSQQRVDVIRWEGLQGTIYEVTPTARRAAFGALIMYRRLFAEKYPDRPAPHLVLVTTDIHPEIARMCAAEGILVELLPPAGVEG